MPAFSIVRKVLGTALIAVVVLAVSGTAPRAADPVTWTRLSGTAIDVSINADGQAYVVGSDGTPWRWDRLEQRWWRMSGKMKRISAAEGNRPWGVDADGVVWRYNGLWWENKDVDVVDVAADTVGNVFIAKADGSIRQWYALRSEWRPVDGSAKRIALDENGRPWVVAPTGEIRAFDGNAWTTWPGRANDIAVGGSGVAAIADAGGQVRTLRKEARSWDLIAGATTVVAVAVTPDGGPWAVTQAGAIMITKPLLTEETQTEQQGAKGIKAPDASAQQIYAQTVAAATAQAPASSPPPAVAPPVVAPPSSPEPPRPVSARPDDVDPAAVTTKETIAFVDTLDTATALAIGKDGSVFGLKAGNVVRWSNTRKRFESFPGSLVRLAVDDGGNPWGVSALGRVFKHDGSVWRQISGAVGADISIGAAGTVMIADASGALFRLNGAGSRFERVSGAGVLIAVGPDDVPWTIRSDKLVQRCDTNPCTTLPQKAQSIGVGPGGSVWIVSDLGLLMRLKDDGKTFETVSTRGRTPTAVAVGPNGYPWIVTAEGKVFASKYFERDESGDRQVAAGTGGNTVGAGASETVAGNQASSFTFTKNMQFLTVGTDAFSSGSYVKLDAGNDGRMWGAASGSFAIYNATTRKFVYESTTLSSHAMSIHNYGVASNGDIWAYIDTQQQTVALYRERNEVLKEYTVSGYTIGGVRVAPDDTVYAIFYTGNNYYVYKKPTTSEVFTRLSNDGDPLTLSVGPGNDLWVVNRSSYVTQWTGSKFEKRPTSGQKAKKISVGADGTVYILDTSDALRKWNAANKTFDIVNNTTGYYIAVDDDGRPWINTDNTPTVKRAKD